MLGTSQHDGQGDKRKCLRRPTRPHGILLSIRRSDRSWPWSLPFPAHITWPVLLSVVLHGISASPLATRYGGYVGKLGDVPEKKAVSEPRIRLRDLAARHHPKAQPPLGTR